MYVAIVFLVLGAVQLTASLIFFQVIDRQTLRDDHARRIAELLVVSDRVHTIAPSHTASGLSTRHLIVDIAARPRVRSTSTQAQLMTIKDMIVAWEPSLADRSLRLGVVDVPGGRKDLIGSVRLADGSWLNFRSRDITSMWPVALRAMVLTLAGTVACLAIGLLLLYRLAKPLRQLTRAAEAIGQGREIAIREGGPHDLRDLAHAMNGMQARISRLLKDQARTFEAISHDLRTPLSRQKVVADLIEDRELAELLYDSVAEMDDLLTSLQAFLRAQHLSAGLETIGLVTFLREVLGEFGGNVTLAAEGDPVIRTFREPVALAVRALVENAVRFGDKAVVSIEHPREGWTIVIEDDGPGIPPEYFEAILDPFFRLDEARARDTKGFGLGIPTAHRLMMRFDGKLAFATAPGGGLIARLTIPVG